MPKLRVLTGVVCTDRDIDLAPQLYKSLRENISHLIMIVTRETDTRQQEFWRDKAAIKTIPHYEIHNRHNMAKIAEKRTIIVDYAQDNDFDAVWFVDSDILPTKGILSALMSTDKDICVAPYEVPWCSYPCVGIASEEPPFVKLHYITLEEIFEERKPCVVGGFGCTLIKSSTFDQAIEYGKIGNKDFYVEGEDIGFFMNCYRHGLTCEYLTRWEQPHYFQR
jgi:hypothetical protein